MKRINNKSSAVFVVISIIIASAMVFSFGCAKKEEKEIKIGAILPLTGDMAVFGEYFKNGINLELDEINKETHGKKLLIIYEDDRGKGDVAVSAFQKLVTSDSFSTVAEHFKNSVSIESIS